MLWRRDCTRGSLLPAVRPAVRRAGWVLAALAAIASTAGAQAPNARGAVRDFDAYAETAARDWNVPGLAIAIVRNDSILLAKGYGVRALGDPGAVDEHTLFGIMSTTKAMTAAALAMLVDEGKVGWDDPVTKHLPGFQLRDPFVTRELTVRDLITHRAGLPNADFLWYANDLDTEEIIRRLRFIEPAYSLRAGFIYQNIMYAVAGEVVRAASGMPWADFLRTRIFAPLGMSRTVATLAESGRMGNVATPHGTVNDTMRTIPNAPVDAVAAAGSVWSSVADMARWLQFMLDSGAVNGRPLLQPASFRELVRPQAFVTESEFYPTAQLTRPHWTTYGMGWFQQDYRGRKVDFHTGSIDGMVAIAGLLLDEGLGVIVLSNARTEARHAVMLKTFDTFTGAPSRDWSAELRALYGQRAAQGVAAQRRLEQLRVAGTRPSLPLERYAGTYSDPLYGTRVVTLENGALRIRGSTSAAATLEHWHYDVFRARWDNAFRGRSTVTFTIGMNGVPTRLEMGGASFRRAP